MNKIRAGDVLEISCPFTEASVTQVSGEYVSLRWPWWQKDPEVEWIEWNGQVALALGSNAPEQNPEVFRTEPDAEHLKPGGDCRVGIPPTIVHVIAVHEYDPPLETGRLPRPRREIVVLRQGESEDPDREEQGHGLDPDDDIPLSIDLVFRPYAFLEVLDDVVDCNGRAWRFDGPWNWHAYDGQGGLPAWPLALLADGSGSAEPGRSAEVAAQTEKGSHETELGRWRQAAL